MGDHRHKGRYNRFWILLFIQMQKWGEPVDLFSACVLEALSTLTVQSFTKVTFSSKHWDMLILFYYFLVILLFYLMVLCTLKDIGIWWQRGCQIKVLIKDYWYVLRIIFQPGVSEWVGKVEVMSVVWRWSRIDDDKKSSTELLYCLSKRFEHVMEIRWTSRLILSTLMTMISTHICTLYKWVVTVPWSIGRRSVWAQFVKIHARPTRHTDADHL